MTDVIWYLTTEMTVDDALTPIVDGVIGFDTEFDKRLPTREEKIIDILFKKVEGSKKAMLLALQVIKQETLVPFPVAWDNIALDSDRRCKARDGDLDAEQLTSAATDASVVLRLYPKLVIALENKQRELRLSIPRNWYSMDSRYGELMRRHPTIQGEILPWSVKDCYWYHAVRPEPTQGQSNLAVITSRRTTAIAKVVELKLQGSFPKWVHGQPYSGLSWLSLHMMRGSTSMAWAEVKALLPTANRLVALRLDQVECRGFPTTGEKLPTMQYLKKFTLNVSHASNARLARAIGMPAVISLTLSARQDKFIYHIIIGNLPAMKVITHLTLHILCTESTTLRSLLCKFPKVTHIDFSSNNVKMFELLATTVSRPLPKQRKSAPLQLRKGPAPVVQEELVTVDPVPALLLRMTMETVPALALRMEVEAETEPALLRRLTGPTIALLDYRRCIGKNLLP
ncbi:hypothetical protein B0H17DRAFT_1212549 [Mycena rosella]|uniref:Uncharacterized protein n=1 Tax=Mycena rosella TaxID=1033263 RepID=A0AAD7CVF9_MYCRO|nr:hypothetical protein B0H17DRAFT_1212549 [Mycena rosella]